MFNYDKYRTEEHPLMCRHKALFVIGLRRSGTSVIRQCLNLHPEIDLLFEPRDIWWSITQGHLQRFRRCSAEVEPKLRFSKFLESDKLCGAKFAFEPGISAMYWRHLEIRFHEPKFIFVMRNSEDTYSSYKKNDANSVQGIISREVFKEVQSQLYASFFDFKKTFPERSIVVSYEELVSGNKLPLEVWKMLGINGVKTSHIIRS